MVVKVHEGRQLRARWNLVASGARSTPITSIKREARSPEARSFVLGIAVARATPGGRKPVNNAVEGGDDAPARAAAAQAGGAVDPSQRLHDEGDPSIGSAGQVSSELSPEHWEDVASAFFSEVRADAVWIVAYDGVHIRLGNQARIDWSETAVIGRERGFAEARIHQN